MLMLQDLALSEPAVCPYIPSEEAVNLYFIAARLDEKELNGILERGWRKFGWYYFRPACGGCERCTPLRVLTRRFEPTKSQRRVIRKNAGVEVRFSDLCYRDEIYEIYLEHSRARFQAAGSPEDFLLSFYNPSCPAIQSEYYKDGRLVGVGFLDRTHEALSSVYFVYRSEMLGHSPGIYSILREVELARSLDLPYYYLGYHVGESSRMAYKGRFRPHEIYSWREKKWVEAD